MFRGFGLCYCFAFVYFVLLQMPLTVRDLSGMHYLLSLIPTTAEREREGQSQRQTKRDRDRQRQRNRNRDTEIKIETARDTET